ncbi:Transcription factor 25 [Corchorus capsularis]|uniref:Transcription factor 25 n=1 Tax=Corchorus capsularis TaxID=210143 RepID=A0A1R3H1C1_COCAP|nr:Transcription factor 25 [Corchorus capsularis]
MSARFLKKILKEQEQQKQRVIEEEEEEQLNGEESESPDSSSRPSKNPFDLLNEGDEEDEDNFDQVDELEVAHENLTRKQEPPSLKSSATAVPASNNKSKKKKKKKSKEGSSNLDKHETPLDVSLDTLSLDVSSSSHQLGSNKPTSENTKVHGDLVKQSTQSILQVDPKYLNVENELRRIFGSKVVKSFEKGNQSSTSRQVRGGRRGSHHIRKTFLISPSDHWARWDGSLSMEFLETKDGYNYFRYTHSSSYDQAQRAFEAAQAIHDLNGVASVLLYHPYHVDSLITMADYFKFVGEHQMSADAIAKCLYAMECAWHPMFTPFQGNCQLKFSHDTNKPLFKALFTHMKNMDRRGCHRSALEVCKLLLALDSDDLMGALFCLDYFALRAAEYAWLERFSEEYRSDSSLWMFPNFSYSLAVCRFYLEQEESSRGSCADSTKASSADLIYQALMLHPSVLKKLVAKVPLKDQSWTNILKNSFFNSDQIGIPSLDHLINIYVERNYLIWRLPDLQKLLRNGALLLVETLEHNKSEAKDWACVRKEAFSSDKNEYAHLLVQDFSDTVQTLPPDNLQNFMVDMREAGQIGGQVANPPAGGHAPPPRDVANRNPLAVLFESLLPWVNYGDAGDGVFDENQVNGQDQDDEDR